MTTRFARKYKIYKATLPLGRLERATGNLTWQHHDCTTCSHTRTYTHTCSLRHAQHGISSFSLVRTKNKTSRDGCRRVFTVCGGSHILFTPLSPKWHVYVYHFVLKSVTGIKKPLVMDAMGEAKKRDLYGKLKTRGWVRVDSMLLCDLYCLGAWLLTKQKKQKKSSWPMFTSRTRWGSRGQSCCSLAHNSHTL